MSPGKNYVKYSLPSESRHGHSSSSCRVLSSTGISLLSHCHARVQPHRRACVRSRRSCFVPAALVGLSSSAVDIRNVRFSFKLHFPQPHECFLVSRFLFIDFNKTSPRRTRLCRRTCTDCCSTDARPGNSAIVTERDRAFDQVRLSFPLPNELHRDGKRRHERSESRVGPVTYLKRGAIRRLLKRTFFCHILIIYFFSIIIYLTFCCRIIVKDYFMLPSLLKSIPRYANAWDTLVFSGFLSYCTGTGIVPTLVTLDFEQSEFEEKNVFKIL